MLTHDYVRAFATGVALAFGVIYLSQRGVKLPVNSPDEPTVDAEETTPTTTPAKNAGPVATPIEGSAVLPAAVLKESPVRGIKGGMTVEEFHESRANLRSSLNLCVYLIIGAAIVHELGRLDRWAFLSEISEMFPREAALISRLISRGGSAPK
jgi:hypothetical protein